MVVSAILLFWFLTNTAMLGWGLAASIPIIIHLWSRRRFREVEWAAMQFLLAALRRSARRLRIEQILLLAVRTIVILLFAIALADPKWVPLSDGQHGPVTVQTHYVFVIDGSYSMATETQDGTRFDLARRRAKNLVQQAVPGDGYSLLLMEPSPHVVLSAPTQETSQIMSSLDTIHWQYRGAELAPTLAYLERLAASTGRQDRRFQRTHIRFFTDLGENTWGAISTPECRSAWTRIADHCELQIDDVGDRTSDNVAVTRLDLGEPYVTMDQDATLSAELQNFGTSQVSKNIEWFVDGVMVSQASATLEAGKSSTAQLTHRWQTSGMHVIELRLPRDHLPVDDQRWLSVMVQGQVDVLCLEGSLDAARFVELALTASESQAQRHIRVTRLAASAHTYTDLHEYDCVFLCDVSKLGENEVTRLSEYVRRGKCLVFTMGELVREENYNVVVKTGLVRGGLLPATLDGTRAERQYSLEPLAYSHPIVASFRGFERAGLLSVPTWKYVRLEPIEGARVALGFDTGDPALVEAKIGRGRCIILATAVSPASLDNSVSPTRPWSALATWPSFPPLVHEIVHFGISASNEGRNVLVGEPLSGEWTKPDAHVDAIMVLPDGRREPLSIEKAGQEVPWSFANTGRNGAYHVLPVADGPKDLFAVNVDTQESDPRRIDVDALPLGKMNEQAVRPTVQSEMTGNEMALFRLLLFAVLGLLLAESFLASRLTAGYLSRTNRELTTRRVV